MKYKLLKQLNEGDDFDILSRILADMERDGELDRDRANRLEKRMRAPTNEPQPERHFYEQERVEDGFKNYISKPELLPALKEKLGTTEISIENIGRLYAGWKICLRDNVILQIDVDELINHREWDRRQHAQPRNTPEEQAALKKSMAKGLQEDGYGIIDFKLVDNGFETWVSEGNHRALIAKELGIPKLPMKMYYK